MIPKLELSEELCDLTEMATISVVTPVYGCSDSLVLLYERLVSTLLPLTNDFEIVMVSDASPDRAWEVIRALCERDRRVKGIHLSRNFGQHHAIAAGLDVAKGDYIVVMDCDLQDEPEEIPKLLAKLEEGYDMVLGRRVDRQDRWLKRKSSEYFYKVLGYLTDSKLDASVGNFGVYRRKVVQAVCGMGDQTRFFPAMVQWVGFSSTAIDIKHGDRTVGVSSYSWSRLFHLASNVVLSFSNKPLRIIIGLGFVVSLGAILYALTIFWRAIFGGIDVPGWSSVIISVWLLSGVHMIVIGIVGVYVGKIFDTAKKRQIYIIKDAINIESRDNENFDIGR